MKSAEIKKIVKESYSEIAKKGSSCCCSCKNHTDEDIAKSIGYSEQELKTPGNMGLGCGNPVALSKIKKGDIVLDLGSGAGFDCFLASKKVGESGKVIGVDMTPAMIERATKNSQKHNYQNVEFRLGEIESLPIDDKSVDVILSNCVINLVPDKSKAFSEAHRVLRANGRMYVSDIVLLGELTNEQKNNPDLLSGCVAGALQKQEYLKIIKKVGFNINILSEDKEISKRQYQGVKLESIKLELTK